MAWVGGLAEWIDGDTAYLSVAFTWLLDEAYTRAVWYRAQGYKVRCGGPALFLVKMQHRVTDVAEVGGDLPDTIVRHNALATIASRGCPVGCWFCIVPKMEGKEFTLLPEFPVRPILCDNNLSALPSDYQDYIISRYQGAGVRIMDANSGFEPRTFTDEVFNRWKSINDGPWRFAYDDVPERSHVERVMKMLSHLPAKKKRVYVLIGNEPIEACMQRIDEVLAWGGEPHVQPFVKLNETRVKKNTGKKLVPLPHVRHDWTPQLLTDVSRWANRFHCRYPFSEYRRSERGLPERYDEQQGLFT